MALTVAELFGLLVSILAVLISAVSLVRSRKTSEKLIELEGKQAALATKQLELIEVAERHSELAQVDVDLVDVGKSWRLLIQNVGQADAKRIEINWSGEPLPLIESEVQEKLPVDRLKPGKFIELIVEIPLDFRTTRFDGVVSWTNPDGVRASDEITLHM